MGIINKLTPDISNKIAAGEVVERPASVIKELVENSIDAGADVINVEIRKGGIAYIRVTDNGCGMERDDAQTAFLRHATSKIHSAGDLDAIYTLGFRGEALSSIGAVARVDLFTKRPWDPEGTHVVCTGGQIETSDDAGTPNGTTFVVSNLFFNTPARMNFLKRDASEAAAITDIIERFILSRPEISFRYIIDGKEKYFTAGDNNLSNCIYAVYGKNYARSVIPVDYESESMKITGMIGKGDAARPNRTYQSFFVNKRYVRSLKLSNAVEAAYKNQIMIGKHPIAILNIEINPKHTDINVHPTKLEVKFSHEEEVYRALFHSVQNALYALPNVPKIERTPAVKSEFIRDTVSTAQQYTLTPAPPSPEITQQPVSAPAAPSVNADEAAKPTGTDNPPKKPAHDSYALDASNDYFKKKQAQFVVKQKDEPEIPEQKLSEDRPQSEQINAILSASAYRDTAEPAPVPFSKTGTEFPAIPGTDLIAEEYLSVQNTQNKWGFDRSRLHIIGQLFDTYILAQAGDTMIIADQHAAHERLKYEELKSELANRKIASQILLVPVVVDLSASEFTTFSENAERFSEMGFEIEDFGNNSVLVRAAPEPLNKEDLQSLIIELTDQLASGKQDIISAKMERALYTIACKAAVKANHRFDNKQLEKLLNAVLDLENINTCPHGRPIIVTMSKKELEKEFKRIL